MPRGNHAGSRGIGAVSSEQPGLVSGGNDPVIERKPDRAWLLLAFLTGWLTLSASAEEPPAAAPQPGQPAPTLETADETAHSESMTSADSRPVPPTLDPEGYTITIHSGFRSVSKVRRLINEIALELIARLGYAETIPEKGESRTGGVPGIAEQRFFVTGASQGLDRRSIELNAIQSAPGTYDVILYGRTMDGSEDRRNPDLRRFLPDVVDLLDQVPAAAEPEGSGPRGHFLFQLSYIQADQAMGLIKALGYSTIEFSKKPGANRWENIYEPLDRGEVRLPYVIKFIEGSKMSLMEPIEPLPGEYDDEGYDETPHNAAIPDIGGTFLHHFTTGEPEQRLLIVYDPDQPDALERLLNVLRDTIDVPARQVVISALVVELNKDGAKDLGVTFSGGNGRHSATFDENEGEQQPFTYTFDSANPALSLDFTATLSALIERGEAEVLSHPSVLVLDGRQARIQIGQQVPVVNSTATAAGITSSVEYFPVGIVLNLRPRINQQGSEVTMQVETIVSAVGQNAATSSAVFFAPTIDNRQVQTFVRVADDTPFIIGGLISSTESVDRAGVPGLSRIPLLGALFRHKRQSSSRKEVIVVLTPHILPPDQPSFSYVIPKDSDIFDSFGNRLFRNAYRIRDEDLHDLHFVDDSEVFQGLLDRLRSRAAEQPSLRSTEPFASLLAGHIPGEEVLVRRMLWDIIQRSGVARDVDPNRIMVFRDSGGPSNRLDLEPLSESLARLDEQNNTLVLTFSTTAGTREQPFAQPRTSVTYLHAAPGEVEQLLLEQNSSDETGEPTQWAIVLSRQPINGVDPLEVLRGVLVLQNLLMLNAGSPLDLAHFHVGRQVIFPTEQAIRQGTDIIDRETAELFFDVVEYYEAFEKEFNRKTQRAFEAMAFGTSP